MPKGSLKDLARRLEAGEVGQEEYDVELDRLLGTGLKPRDQEKEEAWERSRRTKPELGN